MKDSQVLRKLLKEGWKKKRQKGSHITLVHPTLGKMTFPHHGGKELKTGTYNAIAKKAGWK